MFASLVEMSEEFIFWGNTEQFVVEFRGGVDWSESDRDQGGEGRGQVGGREGTPGHE